MRFRRDSYVCSFGDDVRFNAENGADGGDYLAWLRGRIEAFPEGVVHVWRGDRIIGQMEMRLRGSPAIGHVNLFYLIPEERGRGVGDALQRYAEEVFRRAGVRVVQLSVVPGNVRAVRFYARHGWVDLGPRPDDSAVRLMQLTLS